MTRWDRIRFRYGMHWRGKYPCPFRDYGRATKIVAVATLLACIAWLYKGHDVLRQELLETTAWKEAYAGLVLNCANQAMNGGNVGLIFDGKLFGVECVKLSDDVSEYKGKT